MAIGVFDSGIGGLTVLRELAVRFPDDNFIYLGDTARLPYGTKSPETIRKYLEQNLEFLINLGVKSLVVGCNSASTQIRETHFKEVPIFNVIGPGARRAVQVSKSGRIGVLGTRATIDSGAYVSALKKQNQDVEVFSQACPLLVPLAEEHWIDDPVTNLIVFRYLQPLLHHQVDTIIMGCTHYPVLRASIQKAAGNAVELVDSGAAVAEDLQKAFDTGELKRDSGSRTLQLYCTDTAESFQRMAQQLLSPAGLETGQILLADLTKLG